MSDKKFESPEEVQAFLDSNAFADGFRQWLGSSGLLAALGQHLESLVPRLQQFTKTIAPVLQKLSSEFKKWDVSSEVLRKAGWIPHYTTPFDLIAKIGEDLDAVRNQLLHYYGSNWKEIRQTIEARLADYQIDEEAKATMREALDAHEAGLYRCVCRVLFPEIERVFRTKLPDGQTGHIRYEKLVRNLVDDEEKSLGDFMSEGLYELDIFGHLTKHLRDEDESESSKFVYGVFQRVGNEEDRERLKQNPVPNRHAAIHGFVTYDSPQNSLNAIFIADYIFRIIGEPIASSSPP